MPLPIKSDFGRRLRQARDARGISRAALAVRLGISPKTIQSWEMGRTFIEKLDLTPALENELDIDVSAFIAQAVTPDTPQKLVPEPMGAAEPGPPAYASRPPRPGRPRAGPLAATFVVRHAPVSEAYPTDAGRLADEWAGEWVAVPLVRPQAVSQPLASLTERDARAHVLVPASWVPRGSVLVATRMGDSAMAPMIPLGSAVIIDRRPPEGEKDVGRTLAIHFHGKGLRIRRLTRDAAKGKYYGSASWEEVRHRIPFRPEKGDALVGRVVGWLAKA